MTRQRMRVLLSSTGSLALSVTAAVAALPTSNLQGQATEPRVVIATNVACRAAPAASARAVRRAVIGETFVPGARAEQGGDVWHLQTSRTPSSSGGCWIHGSLTAAWTSREHALLAAADRALARRDEASFDGFVAIDNLLLQTPPTAHATETVLDGSPLLQLRRLQILDAAAHAPGTSRQDVARDPLKAAWFFSNRDVLRYHEPAGHWIMEAETYWRLHDRHRDTEAAEEIAWAAAQGAVRGDECDGPCWLERLGRTYARYWQSYPEGRWIDEALARGVSEAERALETGCLWSSAEEARAASDRIRTSLEALSEEARRSILEHVDQLEESCGGGRGGSWQGAGTRELIRLSVPEREAPEAAPRGAGAFVVLSSSPPPWVSKPGRASDLSHSQAPP